MLSILCVHRESRIQRHVSLDRVSDRVVPPVLISSNSITFTPEILSGRRWPVAVKVSGRVSLVYSVVEFR